MNEGLLPSKGGETELCHLPISVFKRDFDTILAESTQVELRGRVTNLRRFGSISFGVLRDQSDETQIAFSDEITPGANRLAKQINTGDIVSVTGLAFVSNTEERGLSVEQLDVVSRFNGPFPDRFKGVQDKGKRRANFPLQLITDRTSFTLVV